MDYLKEFFGIEKEAILAELSPQEEFDKNEKYFRMVLKNFTEYNLNLEVEEQNPTYRRCVRQPLESIWERKWGEDQKDFIVCRGGDQPKLEHFITPAKAHRFSKFKDALIFSMVRTKYRLKAAVDHIYPLTDIQKGEKIWKLCKEKDPLLPYFENNTKKELINAEVKRGYIVSLVDIKKNQPIFI